MQATLLAYKISVSTGDWEFDSSKFPTNLTGSLHTGTSWKESLVLKSSTPRLHTTNTNSNSLVLSHCHRLGEEGRARGISRDCCCSFAGYVVGAGGEAEGSSIFPSSLDVVKGHQNNLSFG